MSIHSPDCLGHYDFEQIARYAKKRFIDGYDTVSLLKQAGSDREKEEIVLVSLLDIEADEIRNLELNCPFNKQCKVLDCRETLKRMIENNLAIRW